MPQDAESQRATRIAAVCALAMVAWQIAAKATRDSLFLLHFDVTALPTMVIVAGLLSILVVNVASVAMSRVTPARLIPVAFVVSAITLLMLRGVYSWQPKVAAVGLYLQIAAIGAVLMSGFWSVVNERFDPRAAKNSFVLIGRAATLGGLVGGIVAERVATWLSPKELLVLLAVIHLFCAFQVRRIGAPGNPVPAEVDGPTGHDIFRKRAYLRQLGMLVMLLTVAAGLLDYWFKSSVVAAYEGEELVRFFAGFYTAVGLATFLIQTFATRFLLRGLGLGRSVALLPAALTLGSVVGFLLPGLVSASLVRGATATLENSVFRSGYELLFIPLDAREKRLTKARIDVSFRRIGDIISGLAVTGILLFGAQSTPILLGCMVALSLAAIWVSSRLQRGYTHELERTLISMGRVLELFSDVPDGITRDVLGKTIGTTDLSTLDKETSLRLFRQQLSVATPPPAGLRTMAPPRVYDIADDVAHLQSGDASRIHAQLRKPLRPSHLPHVLPLLAWDEVSTEAVVAVTQVVPRDTGQITDALLNLNNPKAMRRRVPRTLIKNGEQRAFNGLCDALSDPEFEVRFQVSRALGLMHAANQALTVDKRAIETVVLKELQVSSEAWQRHRVTDELDDPIHAAKAAITDTALCTSDRGLEHVFALLSLILPTEPLFIAYRGLQTDDANLRGTALEYLERVLPAPIRAALWPHLE